MTRGTSLRGQVGHLGPGAQSAASIEAEVDLARRAGSLALRRRRPAALEAVLLAVRGAGRRVATSVVAGLLLSLVLSAVAISLLVGSAAIAHPGRAAVGFNPASDFQVMTWSLAWWPWAIGHGVDPLYTPLLWAPGGFSTLWMTTIPLPALLGLPLTLTAGPLVAYNVLILAAVPLAAGAAYLLCRELAGGLLGPLVGALMFGLSPYMLGHTLSQHLDLTFVFPLPLLALLALRRLRGKISPRRFVAGFALLLLVLLGSSFELFVDLGLVVAIAFVLTVLARGELRQQLLPLTRLVALAYGICLPFIVPLAVLALSEVHGPLRFGPGSYSADLLNLVVPTQTMFLGTIHSLRAVSTRFAGNIGEQDAYLGVPLLAVAGLALGTTWRRGGWLIGALLGTALVLSLGPVIDIGGRQRLSIPFAPTRLPLLASALPARMSLFVALGTSGLAAVWLGRPGRRPLRLVAAAAIALSVLPAFWSPSRFAGTWSPREAFGWSTVGAPQGFLRSPNWRRLIPSGSNLLILPTGDRTAASYWQAATGMRFRLAFPATPFVPPGLAAAPVVSSLNDDDLATLEGAALGGARLRAFLLERHVREVLVVGSAPRWNRVAALATGSTPTTLGPTHLYRVAARPRSARASGALVTAGVRGVRVFAWLSFRGGRAQVWARLRRAGHAAPAARLSSPGADAFWTAAAAGRQGRAAVAFTQWNGRELALRLALHDDGGWALRTITTSVLPIWSPSVLLTGGRSAIVSWVGQHGTTRTLNLALLAPGSRTVRPVVLEQADGLGTAVLGARNDGSVICAWSDAAATENRIRVSVLGSGGWSPPLTLATTRAPIRSVSLVGHSTRVVWRAQPSPSAPAGRFSRGVRSLDPARGVQVPR